MIEDSTIAQIFVGIVIAIFVAIPLNLYRISRKNEYRQLRGTAKAFWLYKLLLMNRDDPRRKPALKLVGLLFLHILSIPLLILLAGLFLTMFR